MTELGSQSQKIQVSIERDCSYTSPCACESFSVMLDPLPLIPSNFIILGSGFSSLETLSSTRSFEDETAPDLTGAVSILDGGPIFEGTYSTVFKGVWNGTKVAIKQIRVTSTSTQSMRRVSATPLDYTYHGPPSSALK